MNSPQPRTMFVVPSLNSFRRGIKSPRTPGSPVSRGEREFIPSPIAARIRAVVRSAKPVPSARRNRETTPTPSRAPVQPACQLPTPQKTPQSTSIPKPSQSATIRQEDDKPKPRSRETYKLKPIPSISKSSIPMPKSSAPFTKSSTPITKPSISTSKSQLVRASASPVQLQRGTPTLKTRSPSPRHQLATPPSTPPFDAPTQKLVRKVVLRKREAVKSAAPVTPTASNNDAAIPKPDPVTRLPTPSSAAKTGAQHTAKTLKSTADKVQVSAAKLRDYRTTHFVF